LELGIHLPLMEFGDEGLSLARLTRAVDAARDCRFAAVSANDHFLFGSPWLDGPTALAAVLERSGSMELATTVALVSLRGPVQLAKSLAALDVLSEGRLIAGVGPGSSERDYDIAGVPFDERWTRFEEAVKTLRGLLGPESPLAPHPVRRGGIPIWLASWGSAAGLRRVARLGEGWFASAYNTTPEAFAAARGSLPRRPAASGSTCGRWATSRARSSWRLA
jgi:alkanesulfonate monooxygenase SsuD/methylene tetrahydromethanopterin reductase-like flavin-dependent oxidoreductase (luciferase family)